MADFITGISTGSSNTHIKAFGSSDAIGTALIKEFDMDLVTGAVKFWSNFQAPLTDSEREFEEQKKLFENIPPLLLEPYRGLFVISHNGEILDADEKLDTLTNRFFSEHADMPIYVDKIGGQFREVIDTHF